MADRNIELIAHLMRRAGYGATRDQIEDLAEKGYEATVEELIHSPDPRSMPDDLIRRYHNEYSGQMGNTGSTG